MTGTETGQYEEPEENYTCQRCGTTVTPDGAGGAPTGWTQREWETAVIAAIEAGECPECDHDAVRASGVRAELIGED